MKTSIKERQKGIPVKVFYESGEVNQGALQYCKEGPILNLDNQTDIDDFKGVKFSFIENSQFSKIVRIEPYELINFNPEVSVILNYTPENNSQFEMYPPSTDGWLSHVVERGHESVFTIQTLQRKEKKLLTIVDTASDEIYFAGLVYPYESSILMMLHDLTVLRKIQYGNSSDERVFDILKAKSLSWSTLSELVAGVTIPSLTIRKTMEETLDQLVPLSFSPDIRKQIIAFLAWLEKAEIPKEDPTDFLRRYQSVAVYRQLARGHLQCLLDKVNPPNYVRLMFLAERGQLELAKRPQHEAAEMDPWTLFHFKLHETFPDWTGRVVKYAIDLQSKGKIVTELPVSKDSARDNEKAWSDRFAMANHGLIMRGHIRKETLGLLPVVYVGAAHRWPHKHLEWSARLGYGADKPQFIQIMVMPPSAYERASRIMPNLRLVDWERSSFNLSLFSQKEQKWRLKTSLIAKSIDGKKSIRQLENEFSYWRGTRYTPLNQDQARILDLISWGLYLDNLEAELYSKYYNISRSMIKHELDKMLEQGVFLLQYPIIMENVRSLCILADGPIENICSLSRAFLKHAPSTQIRITDSGSSCVIVSRVPEDDYYNLVTSLSDAANKSQISLKIMPISAYTGYRNNLYSRLLKNDGSWDDDVSGLLSQSRSQI